MEYQRQGRAIWSAVSLRILDEMLSGPAALCGLMFLSSFYLLFIIQCTARAHIMRLKTMAGTPGS